MGHRNRGSGITSDNNLNALSDFYPDSNAYPLSHLSAAFYTNRITAATHHRRNAKYNPGRSRCCCWYLYRGLPGFEKDTGQRKFIGNGTHKLGYEWDKAPRQSL
jgi:hypothetical protein